MINDKTTDLCDAAAPEDVVRILRRAADELLASTPDLQAAWQDRTAGVIWTTIAKELERCAARIEKKL
jgi:hypothetical protein